MVDGVGIKRGVIDTCGCAQCTIVFVLLRRVGLLVSVTRGTFYGYTTRAFHIQPHRTATDFRNTLSSVSQHRKQRSCFACIATATNVANMASFISHSTRCCEHAIVLIVPRHHTLCASLATGKSNDTYLRYVAQLLHATRLTGNVLPS
jgi:hypothetical protein